MTTTQYMVIILTFTPQRFFHLCQPDHDLPVTWKKKSELEKMTLGAEKGIFIGSTDIWSSQTIIRTDDKIMIYLDCLYYSFLIDCICLSVHQGLQHEFLANTSHNVFYLAVSPCSFHGSIGSHILIL